MIMSTAVVAQPISRSNSLASGLDSFGLTNQAFSLVRSGDLVGAERLLLQALDVKTKGFGGQSPQVAATLHALAEVEMRLGKMADAERNLRSAVAIRADSDKHNDLVEGAKSRELLAQILEAAGNLSGAKAVRLNGHPDAIACGNSKVRSSAPRTASAAAHCYFSVSCTKLQHRTPPALRSMQGESIQSAAVCLARLMPARSPYSTAQKTAR